MKTKEGGVMDINKEREAFEKSIAANIENFCDAAFDGKYYVMRNNSRLKQRDKEFLILSINRSWVAWQAAKAQAVPEQLDVNSILHDIDCYFDNGLSNTERTANNLLQSIYEKLSGEVKAQEPANE